MIEAITKLKTEANLKDRDVIGSLFQEMDNGKDFVEGDNNYVWFYAIGQYFKPKVIVEMGTRFGYSMKCFVEGAGHIPQDYSLWVYDMECDGIKTLDIFETYFREKLLIHDLHVNKINTQKIDKLSVDREADLVLVDAEHSVMGCVHECSLGWPCLRSGGVMVIDDVFYDAPRQGAMQFCNTQNIAPIYLPSLRGTYLLIKP